MLQIYSAHIVEIMRFAVKKHDLSHLLIYYNYYANQTFYVFFNQSK